MDCRETRERLSDYRDRAIPPAEAEAVDAHLRACRECAGIDRSLAELREGLRRLPPLAAPPELMTRIREAIAGNEGGAATGARGAAVPQRGRSAISRLRIPLEAAAAVLLVASILWYQRGDSPPPVPLAPAAPERAASPLPPAPPVPAIPGQETRLARQAGETPPGGGEGKKAPVPTPPAARKDTASLPPGTPAPAPRPYSAAELPAAPAVRASTESPRIVPRETSVPAGPDVPGSGIGAASGTVRDAAPAPGPKVLAAPSSRSLHPLRYGREIVLEVTRESRGNAGQSVADAARRLGGAVERVERDPSEGTPVAVSVLLPESAATPFLSEMERIGKVPSAGEAADQDIPPGPVRGTVAYTVRIRTP